MKKSLLALAALSAFATAAQAQSSVTVYGVLDLAYSASKNASTNGSAVTTTTKQTNTGNGDGALSTSVIGFRGVEDLGAGLKANFQLEYDLVDAGNGGNGSATSSKTTADAATTTNAANGLGARFSWVGISDAKLGELRLGRQAQSIHSVVVGGSAGAGNNVAGATYSAGMNANANDASIRPHLVFVNRAITYVSPTINGVTVEVQNSRQNIDNAGTETYNKEVGGSVKYAVGNLAAAYGRAVTTVDSTSLYTITGWTAADNVGGTAASTTSPDLRTKQEAFAASYDFGVVKVFGLHAKRKETVSTSGALNYQNKTNELGLRAPLGKTTLFASMFKGDRTGDSTSALATGNADLKGHQLGATYAFSNRTTAYAIYGQQEIKGAGATDNDLKLKTVQTSIGVRHAF